MRSNSLIILQMYISTRGSNNGFKIYNCNNCGVISIICIKLYFKTYDR